MFHNQKSRQVLSFVFGVFVCSVAAQCQQQQIATIGDLHLKNGGIIKDCRIGYRTYGALNKNHSNAILWPTWFLGRSADLSPMIGPNKLLDTERFFVIAVDALGNGVSSSPSNSKDQPGISFPEFTIEDMVASQHILLTEKLGVSHLHALIGQSMGGIQAFQWMVDYPDFMDRTVTVMGTPRLSTSDVMWLSIELQSILNDKDWNGGIYTTQPKLLATKYIQQLVMTSPDQINAKVPPELTQQFMSQISGSNGFDANDWLYQIKAILPFNIFQGRSVRDTAKLIKSKVMMINGTQDHAVNWKEPADFARMINSKPILLNSACGHGAASCEAATLTPQVVDFLR